MHRQCTSARRPTSSAPLLPKVLQVALLLNFAEARIGKTPTALALVDLDARLILSFLDHLEKNRNNGARSRNARLAALRSFLKYAAHYDLTALPVIEQALAIPMKRFDRTFQGKHSWSRRAGRGHLVSSESTNIPSARLRRRVAWMLMRGSCVVTMMPQFSCSASLRISPTTTIAEG